MIDQYITGSNGFLGKHLATRLHGNTVAIHHSLITEIGLKPYRRFFFLSAYGNMSDQTNVGMMLKANVRALEYVLQRTLSFGYKQESFIYVSSSSVTLPVQTPYSRTKRAAEEMVLATPLSACVMRPYSIVGRGEQSQHLIPTLIRSCMEGTPMGFVPDATHDYIDVDDVANGLLWMAANRMRGVFELGSGKPTTNAEVLGIVEKACGKSANINVVGGLREYDNPGWYCKNPRWIAVKTLEQSVSEMVEAYRAA